MTTWRLLAGDVRATLATLPAASVQCCVTSPPYFGLRDYGMAGQIGLESTPDAYVAQMVAVFRDVRRVLRDDSTVWLNLGDSYAGSWGAQSREHAGKHAPNVSALSANQVKAAGIRESGTGSLGRTPGCKAKDLVGIPWMVAFALRADGWYLRSDIIWHKPNPMPESVTDRPTKAHEYLFLLTKASRYYYDAAAIREDAVYGRSSGGDVFGRVREGDHRDGRENKRGANITGEGGDRNKRTVWTVATQPFPGSHFATYPEDLIEPCILAGSRVGDTVLDPFTGSGTTGAVAVRHQRSFVGCELNPAYLQLARERIGNVAPMFAMEVA